MNRGNWKQIAEITGILAIVGSLLFVGFQLRQDRQIAKAQITVDRELKQIEMSSLIAENSDVWIRGLRDDELTESEQAVFETIVHAFTVKYDALHDRAETELGTRTVTDDISRQFAMSIYSHPGMRRTWEARCEFLKGISGNDIPPCARVRVALDKILNGDAAAPIGSILSP